jgi:hypothetical protein
VGRQDVAGCSTATVTTQSRAVPHPYPQRLHTLTAYANENVPWLTTGTQLCGSGSNRPSVAGAGRTVLTRCQRTVRVWPETSGAASTTV